MNDKYISVSDLNKYIKNTLEYEPGLNEVFLKGEISNFKNHTSGHFYFTLKDEKSRINAVMFAGNNRKIKFKPMDGMKVLVTGKVSVYEATGGYQIYVNDMLEDGLGNLYVAYEQLKEKLEKEGLFNEEHKKPIPSFPEKIGIITAPTGAAVKDILSTINRRWPIVETILFPSLVQGESAAVNIIKQLKKADEYNLDVIIIGRGGGSIEDMWCFNDEQLARVIYNAKTPIVSAVGHEIDFTISDFVADLRAPTPTGAGELVVPNKTDALKFIDQLKKRTITNTSNLLNIYNKNLLNIKNSYILKNPHNIYLVKAQQFDNVVTKLELVTKDYYKTKSNQFTNLLNKVELLNPLHTMKRGYAIIKDENELVIDKVSKVTKNQVININLQDGVIKTKVIEGEANDN